MKEKINFLTNQSNNPSQERNRLFYIAISSSFLSKGVSLFVSLVSVPLTLKYLGSTGFAILSTIISTFSVLSYFDFGIGVGLQNILPLYIAQNSREKIVEAISTVFLFLLCASFIVVSIGFLVTNVYDLRVFFNLTESIDKVTFRNTILACIFLIGFGMPISIIQRIQIAYQKAFINEWITTIGGVLSLGLLFLVIKLHLSLPYVLLALQGALFIGILINFTSSLISSRLLQIDFKRARIQTFKSMAKIGLKYFLLLVLSVGLFTIDNFFLLRFRLPENVTEYTVCYRFISLLNVPVIIYANTFLPAYNDANAREDRAWIKKNFKYAFKIITIICVVEGIAFFFFGELLINRWAKTDFEFTYFKSISLVLLLFFLNVNFFISTIAVSVKYLNHTLKYFSVGVIITIALKFFVSHFLQGGYTSIIIPTIVVMPIFFLIPICYKIYQSDIKTI